MNLVQGKTQALEQRNEMYGQVGSHQWKFTRTATCTGEE